MNTVADFKRRLAPGTKVYISETFLGKADPSDPINSRIVHAARSQDFQTILPEEHSNPGKISHANYPKKAQTRFHVDGEGYTETFPDPRGIMDLRFTLRFTPTEEPPCT